jgi:predicted ester cyclase
MNSMTEPLVAIGLAEAERAAVVTFYRAIGEGRPDLLDDAVTVDWQDIPLAPRQAPGREGIKPLIAGVAAAFCDLRITIHEIIGVLGRAAVRGEMTGTHAGTWLGVSPTGRTFRVTIHEFHAIENGRLTHTWHLEDWFGWLNQAGAWPAALPAASEAA